MFSTDRPQNLTEKGLGWVPDNPDERDYDLYTEITKQYSGNDSNGSLKRVHNILDSIDSLPFKARQEVDRLAEDLEQFDFVKVNTYQVLSEKKKDRRVVLLKFLMVYFYQRNIVFSRPNKPRLGSQEESLEELKKISNIKATLRTSIKENLKANVGEKNQDNRIDLEKDNFLVFLDEANRYWSWLNDEEYDFILRALVYGFQTWVNNKVVSLGENSEKHEIVVDGIVGIQTYTYLREWLKVGTREEDQSEEKQLGVEKQEGIKPSSVNSEEISGEGDTIPIPVPASGQNIAPKSPIPFRQAVFFSRVPFSTSLPPDMLRAVFELLFKEYNRVTKLKDRINLEEIGFRVEKLARDNFFEVEPILSVINLIAGPIGSYPKTLRTALEIATKTFALLFKEDKPEVVDGFGSILGIKHGLSLKPPIYSPGQTIQLPDRDFIALEEERKNFDRLKSLARDSVALSVERIKIYLKETLRRDLLTFKTLVQEEVGDNREKFEQLSGAQVQQVESLPSPQESSFKQKLSESFKLELENLCESAYFIGQIHETFVSLLPSEPRQEEDKKVSKVIEAIRGLSNQKLEADFTKWFTEPIEEKNFSSTFNNLIDLLIELKPVQLLASEENSGFKDLVTLELTDEPSGSDRTSCSSSQTVRAGDRPTVNFPDSPSKNEINQWLFPSYLVPGGASLLKNRKAAKRRFESVEGKDNQIRTYTYLPQIVDLSLWCSPIYDQGPLQSCSAQAGAALVEYFARRYGGGNKEVSRRFLYKITRNLMGRTGDSGSSLRETIKAMALFGVPPESYWRYDTANFDEEPTPFCYSFAQNYQALNYFRIDQPNIMGDELLTRIKIALAAGFPCTFGFTLHESIHDPFNVKRGYIPYPGKLESSLSTPDVPVGGHAALAVGYHDFKRIIKSNNPQEFSEGAFLIRNSWGTSWGLNGYGWLPYDYLLQGLTSDWWSLIKLEWLESGKFGLGGARSFGGTATGTPGSGGNRG